MKGWRSKARREYRQYLAQRIAEVHGHPAEWQKIRRGWCWGSEGFVERMKARLEELAQEPRERESWAGPAVEELEENQAERVLLDGMKVLSYKKVEELQGLDRFLLAKLIRQRSKVRVAWVAQRLGLRTREGMSSSLSRIGRLLHQDRALQKKWHRLTSQ